MQKNSFYIDKSSFVNTKSIGADTKIWQFCVVLAGAVIGKNVNINAHCFVENQVIVGDNVTIKSGVYLWDGITIESKVQIGPNATFTNDKYPRAKNKDFKLQKILIREGASVGASSIILGGTTVGKFSMIGAATLVDKDIPNYALVYGNPAKVHGYVCECGNKLTIKNGRGNCSDSECGKLYEMVDKKVRRLK